MDLNNFNSLEIDAIGEILNISLGASATAVSTMLSRRVDITTPNVRVLSFDEFEFGEMEPAIGVEITYVSGLNGSNIMLLKRHDVKVIVEILMGCEIPDSDFELDEMNLSAICEVMNQMMGASSTALSEFLGELVNISTPVSFEIMDVVAFKKKYFQEADKMVVASFTLKIEEAMESEFLNVMSVPLAKRLVSAFELDSSVDTGTIEQPPEPMPSVPEPEPSSSKKMSQAEIEAMLGQMAPAPEPAPEPSSSKKMSQAEIEAMLGQMAPAPEPTPEPSSSKKMSQAEIEAMLGQMAPASTPAPEPPKQPEPDSGQPPYGMPPYGMPPQQQQGYPQQPYGPYGMQMPYGPYGMQMPYGAYGMPPAEMPQPQQAAKPEPKVINVQPMTPSSIDSSASLGVEQAENLSLIMEVPLEITVEIGRTKRLVKEILEFSSGSLVVLDKLAGEQVDLFVNGQCIAKGDVVVVDDNFGVRITEIIKRPELKLEGHN